MELEQFAKLAGDVAINCLDVTGYDAQLLRKRMKAMIFSVRSGFFAASPMCGSLKAATGMGTRVREGWWSVSLTNVPRSRSR